MNRPTFDLCLFSTLFSLLLIPSIGSAQSSTSLQASDSSRLSVVPRDVITLYSSTGYRGRSESFRVDDRRLGDNTIGNDGAVSIRVRRGCRAELFEHYDFEGRSVVVTQDVSDLARTRLGRNEVSSVKVSCSSVDPDRAPDLDDSPERSLRGRRGALVFSETRFRGRFQFFDASVSDLGAKRIGSKSISSVRVSEGCRLTLFTERDFQGKRTKLRKDARSLRRTGSGPDTASSLIVACSGPQRGVELFTDSHFRGKREVLSRDVARLSQSALGANRLGSVLVNPGCKVTLFAEPDFRGTSAALDKDTPHLVGLPVGPDAASSVRVRCKGSAPGGDALPYGSGVMLYDRSHFSGEGVSVRADLPRLTDSRVGDDRASSIRVAPGCEAILFRDSKYRGRGTRIEKDVADLDTVSAIGSNRLSSIRVRCNSWVKE